MQPCMDKVVRLIAYELVASGGRPTTIALVCCCRSFEDPALDVLWGTLETLLLLFESFPEDVWNWGRCTVSLPTTHALSLFQLLGLKDFPKTPNYVGVGSVPEVHPKDAKALGSWDSKHPILGGVLSFAALCHQ